MKNGKAPHKKDKIAMSKVGLNHENWLVFKRVDNMIHIVHRITGTVRIIPII